MLSAEGGAVTAGQSAPAACGQKGPVWQHYRSPPRLAASCENRRRPVLQRARPYHILCGLMQEPMWPRAFGCPSSAADRALDPCARGNSSLRPLPSRAERASVTNRGWVSAMAAPRSRAEQAGRGVQLPPMTGCAGRTTEASAHRRPRAGSRPDRPMASIAPLTQ